MNYSSNANRPKTGLFTLDKCVVPFAKKNGDSSKESVGEKDSRTRNQQLTEIVLFASC